MKFLLIHVSSLWRPLRLTALHSGITATPPICSFGSLLDAYLMLPVIKEEFKQYQPPSSATGSQLPVGLWTSDHQPFRPTIQKFSVHLMLLSIQNISLQLSNMEYHDENLTGVKANNICYSVSLSIDQVSSPWKTNQVVLSIAKSILAVPSHLFVLRLTANIFHKDLVQCLPQAEVRFTSL